MRFGYGLITCQRHPEQSLTDRELYREAIDLAIEAETLGFDSVWTSEHHFADDAYMPSLLPLSAAIAARTQRVEIGTGLVLAPLYDPIRLAEDAATVDLISDGRFILGLGLGWLDWELEAFGTSLRDRVRRLELALETCRQAWGDGLVARLGVSVTPKPARPGGPPIWIGAHAEPAVRRAAALADGWMAGEPGEDDLATALGWIRAERGAEAHAGSFAISGYWPVFTSEEPGAWEQVRPYLHYMEWKYEDAEGAKGRVGELPQPPELDAQTEAALRATIICGTPDEVTAQIGQLRAIAGPELHFIGRHYFPGMDRDVMRRATALFAEQVIPMFR